MVPNLEKYKNDIDSLAKRGEDLVWALRRLGDSGAFDKQVFEAVGEQEGKKFLDTLPDFRKTYQRWYSEAQAVVSQLLPSRLPDFCRLHDRPKNRKEVDYETYTIEDALQGLTVTRSLQQTKIVGPEAAAAKLQQQVAIIAAAKTRFETTLFDIRQLLQADLFDSEIDAARHLLKNKFGRASGALAGVIIEKHLAEVATQHKVVTKKKDPTIADLNEALKAADIIDIPTWRFIQHLADIRNLCDHNKSKEPTIEQVQDLLDGTAKLIKTVF